MSIKSMLGTFCGTVSDPVYSRVQTHDLTAQSPAPFVDPALKP